MDKNIKNVTVIGAGYVGLSLSLALSKYYDVTIIEIDSKKVDFINNKKSFLVDTQISNELQRKNLRLKATSNKSNAIKSADLIFCCLPTNFNEKSNSFNTKTIEDYARFIKKNNPNSLFIIRSTVPIGFTERINKKLSTNIVFIPEFLREGSALEDTWNPSRIVIGISDNSANNTVNALKEVFTKISKNKRISFLVVGPSEAEAIKLFSNTFLAMRIGFFNELDSFAMQNNLNTESIIKGLSKDKRIGNFYNNPSFGFGGYCLPKDTKQTVASLRNVPSQLINSIDRSNTSRKKFLANKIIRMKHRSIGIYRLNMKKDSDNFRDSASIDLIKNMKKMKKYILIYEPLIKANTFEGFAVEHNLDNFLMNSDIIVANRVDSVISNFKSKVFTRDIFNTDK